MKGLYILSSEALNKLNVIKFGMSECLQNRVYDYKNVFKDPYYMACYELSNNFDKIKITQFEQIVLNKTLNYKTEMFASEYRKIEFVELNKIVCDTLNEHNIPYIYHKYPSWDKILLVDKIIKHQCDTCKETFKQKSHLDDHKNKKNKCQPEIIDIPKILNDKQIIQNTQILTSISDQSSDKIIKHQCDTCKTIFKKKNHLDNHLNRKNKCQLEFNDIPKISNNNQNILNDNPIFPNTQILTSINDQSLNKFKKHQCDTCKITFKQKSHLDDHKNRKNKCQPEIIDIPKILNDKQNIQNNNQNTQTLTSISNQYIPNNNQNIPNTQISTSIKNKCHYCNKIFSRRDALTRHMAHYCSILKEKKNEQEINEQKILDKIVLLEHKNDHLEEEIKNLKKEINVKQPKIINNINGNNVQTFKI